MIGAELPGQVELGSEPAVAITTAPACFASWIAAVLTPLAAAWIMTVSPGWSRPEGNKPRQAVE
jgi:hypothetical protein